MVRNYLAMDFGGSSGRAIIGSFDGRKLSLHELLRFPDYYTEIHDICYWDTYMMFYKMKEAIAGSGALCGADRPVSIGIDTWGTDYGLLDKKGNPLGTAVCERNTKGLGRKCVENQIGKAKLYECTGTHFLDGNILFQLYERKLRADPALETAGMMLMLPDLLGYFLTGETGSEYSDAATSMLLNVQTETWNKEILKALELPDDIYPEVLHAGERRFPLTSAVKNEAGMYDIVYAPVLAHDTASAVASVPLKKGEAFCSSGTWSILGITGRCLIKNERALEYNFSSSKLAEGIYKIHRDFMGMWMLSQCQKEWKQYGTEYTWKEITKYAEAAEKFRVIIDVDEPFFFNTGNMLEKIRNYCERTSQKFPEGVGAVSRCIYEGLALRYRRTIEELEKVSNEKICSIRIIGGGSNNELMNQMVADATGRPVTAGPAEAACVGNILFQMKADGQTGSMEQGQEITERSFMKKYYEPQNTRAWDEYYERYRELIS